MDEISDEQLMRYARHVVLEEAARKDKSNCWSLGPRYRCGRPRLAGSHVSRGCGRRHAGRGR